MLNFALYLKSNPEFFLFSVFLLSLMVGSFLNVVIYRLPIMMKKEWKSDCLSFLADEEGKTYASDQTQTFNLSVPRSKCPSCGHLISAIENIPVVSWLFLKGRCRHCQTKISIRYPIVELTTACLSALVAFYFGFSWMTLGALLLTWSLIVLTLIDFDTQLLPDSITLPLMWLGILMSLLGMSGISLQDSVIGTMAGYLSLWSVYWLFKLMTGKEGMGYGDFKLLAALGAWMGWQALPMIILLSALVGAVVGISLILFLGRDKNIPIPFGPYLAAAGFISLLWGEKIKLFYFQLAGL